MALREVLLPSALSLAAVVAAPFLWIWPVVNRYGMAGSADSPLGPFMSPGWYVVTWLVTAPMMVLAAEALVRSHPWAATCCLTLAVLAMAWVSSLPVGLRFFGTQEPVTLDEVEMAAHSYALLLAGAAATAVGWALVTPSRVRGRGPVRRGC
ncbi:MAG: hypothetical protein Q8O61_16340 [Nocardioides sp.]|nr:hypothetical protein [Nocardioides sp.]